MAASSGSGMIDSKDASRAPAALYEAFNKLKDEKDQLQFIQNLGDNEIQSFIDQEITNKEKKFTTTAIWMITDLKRPSLIVALINKLYEKATKDKKLKQLNAIPPLLNLSIVSREQGGNNLLSYLINNILNRHTIPKVENSEGILKKVYELTSPEVLNGATEGYVIYSDLQNKKNVLWLASFMLDQPNFQEFIGYVSPEVISNSLKNLSIKKNWTAGGDATTHQLVAKYQNFDGYKTFIEKADAESLNKILILTVSPRYELESLFEKQNFENCNLFLRKVSPFLLLLPSQFGGVKKIITPSFITWAFDLVIRSLQSNENLTVQEKEQLSTYLTNLHLFLEHPKGSITTKTKEFMDFISNYLKPDTKIFNPDRWVDLINNALTKAPDDKIKNQLMDLQYYAYSALPLNDPNTIIRLDHAVKQIKDMNFKNKLLKVQTKAYLALSLKDPETIETLDKIIRGSTDTEAKDQLLAFQARIYLNKHDHQKAMKNLMQISNPNHLNAAENKLVSEELLTIAGSLEFNPSLASKVSISTSGVDQQIFTSATSPEVMLSLGRSKNCYEILIKALLHAKKYLDQTKPQVTVTVNPDNKDVKTDVKDVKTPDVKLPVSLEAVQPLDFMRERDDNFTTLVKGVISPGDEELSSYVDFDLLLITKMNEYSRKSLTLIDLGWPAVAEKIKSQIDSKATLTTESERFLVTLAQLKTRFELADFGSENQKSILKEMVTVLQLEKRKQKPGLFSFSHEDWYGDTIKLLTNVSKSLDKPSVKQVIDELQKLNLFIEGGSRNRTTPIERDLMTKINKTMVMVEKEQKDIEKLKVLTQSVKEIYLMIHQTKEKVRLSEKQNLRIDKYIMLLERQVIPRLNADSKQWLQSKESDFKLSRPRF